MQNTNKLSLLAQMEEQRFLPVTEKTLLLYNTYHDIIDLHNPDELSRYLFYIGEYYFRIGDFSKSLNHLTRCLHAPKKTEQKYLDVLSYNIIGLIYAYLGLESIAINHFLQCKEISTDMHLERELTVCCANLAHMYHILGDYVSSTEYYKTALQHANSSHHFYNLAALCEIYLGIIYCKMNKKENALSIFKHTEQLNKKNTYPMQKASLLNFYIQLHVFLQDETFLQKNLSELETLQFDSTDFLELSEFYFDICDFLLKYHRKEDLKSLLDWMEPYTTQFPLSFLRYQYLKRRIYYAERFSLYTEYKEYASQFIELEPTYLKEQRQAKLHGLAYIEQLRQAKNDSEESMEKSQLDQMTGLLNKYTIQVFVEDELYKQKKDTQSAIILIDLDHFKEINDTLGHLAGDNFICLTASIIQKYFKENALCGRIGGDEFLIYVSNISDTSSILLQTEFLRQEICKQHLQNKEPITAHVSIGIAFSSENHYNYQTLFEAADNALYQAKTEGRNKIIAANPNR